MAGIFQRLFKTGQAEAHALVDKFEDPIKMSEQAVRDLKKDLQESLRALAEVKSISIRMNKEAEDSKRLTEDYERKAMLLLQKGESGQLDAGEAERLARESLTKMESTQTRYQSSAQQAEQQQQMAAKLQANVNELKSKISSYENDLVTLKARTKTANATRKINQHLANIDSNGTVAMLERMKEKAQEQEALAEAYGDMAEASHSVDDEINKALAGSPDAKADDSLARLKAKMGMQEGGGA
ncbi:MAG: PspA/IM30 family protein [Gemmatimonadetes bacterium]|jgi:phage shock protein A|nr:PspA/IM30 family protein [Gemmatimonadota bacterium]